MTYEWESGIPIEKLRWALRVLLGPRFDAVGLVVVETDSVEAALIRLQDPYDAVTEADVWGDALGDCQRHYAAAVEALGQA